MAQKNIGLQLARLAKRHAFSVPKIVDYTGATRCTVYNWLAGRGVSPAYQPSVLKLVQKLEARNVS